MYYLLVSDEDFLSVKILVNVSIKNFLENLEIETTLQSGFDRNVTTLKSRYSDLDPEGGGGDSPVKGVGMLPVTRLV